VKGVAPLLNGRPDTGAGHWASARPAFWAWNVTHAPGSGRALRIWPLGLELSPGGGR